MGLVVEVVDVLEEPPILVHQQVGEVEPRVVQEVQGEDGSGHREGLRGDRRPRPQERAVIEQSPAPRPDELHRAEYPGLHGDGPERQEGLAQNLPSQVRRRPVRPPRLRLRNRGYRPREVRDKSVHRERPNVVHGAQLQGRDRKPSPDEGRHADSVPRRHAGSVNRLSLCR